MVQKIINALYKYVKLYPEYVEGVEIQSDTETFLLKLQGKFNFLYITETKCKKSFHYKCNDIKNILELTGDSFYKKVFKCKSSEKIIREQADTSLFNMTEKLGDLRGIEYTYDSLSRLPFQDPEAYDIEKEDSFIKLEKNFYKNISISFTNSLLEILIFPLGRPEKDLPAYSGKETYQIFKPLFALMLLCLKTKTGDPSKLDIYKDCCKLGNEKFSCYFSSRIMPNKLTPYITNKNLFAEHEKTKTEIAMLSRGIGGAKTDLIEVVTEKGHLYINDSTGKRVYLKQTQFLKETKGLYNRKSFLLALRLINQYNALFCVYENYVVIFGVDSLFIIYPSRNN